jgi:predicted lysophospholipase L1 biosynthesis ABC-type transport system permease subunit
MFAIFALVLAGTGLYSVVSFAVSQRTQEVGIRMALGAPRTSIVRLVPASTSMTLGIGLALGLILSVALHRILSSWSGGNSRDPLTLMASSLILVFVALIACLVPAWRAATIDPMRALRNDPYAISFGCQGLVTASIDRLCRLLVFSGANGGRRCTYHAGRLANHQLGFNHNLFAVTFCAMQAIQHALRRYPSHVD